jgi:hypothetical protein
VENTGLLENIFHISWQTPKQSDVENVVGLGNTTWSLTLWGRASSQNQLHISPEF